MRKRRRRLEAEEWVASQTDVVASHVDEVYHWLGTNPKPEDNAIIYNRRNKKHGFGDGGQCIMHMGYNGWQGQPRQVGMQPLAHDHPARVEYWLDSGGGDWWIADPIYIHPEAKVLDFVFSNGEGTYDNAGGRDYHAPVGLEDGTLPPEEDHVAKREAILEEERGPLDATAARTGRGSARSASFSPDPRSRPGRPKTRPPPRLSPSPLFPSPANPWTCSTAWTVPTPSARCAPTTCSSRARGTGGRIRTGSDRRRCFRRIRASCRADPTPSRRTRRRFSSPRTLTSWTFTSRTRRPTGRGTTTASTASITTSTSPAPGAATPSCAWSTSRWRWRPSRRLERYGRRRHRALPRNHRKGAQRRGDLAQVRLHGPRADRGLAPRG